MIVIFVRILVLRVILLLVRDDRKSINQLNVHMFILFC